jgi:hypothetical protein
MRPCQPLVSMVVSTTYGIGRDVPVLSEAHLQDGTPRCVVMLLFRRAAALPRERFSPLAHRVSSP